MNRSKNRIAWALIAVSWAGFTLAEQGVQHFDIPAQSTSEALNAFSKQSGLRLLFSYDAVEGKRADAISGEFSVDEVLKKLLAGTGLGYEITKDSVVLIRAAGAGSAALSSSGETTLLKSGAGGMGGLRLAQGETETSDSAAKSAEDEELHEIEISIPEILVTGRKTLNMDIKRSEDAAQPYVVFDRQDIERSGARNIEEFFRTRLTESTSFVTRSQAVVDSSGGGSSISLRGLGEDETLILIDGRRIASARVAGESTQPNLNGIPVAAIERIEILPTTASGIYGGGATGGVINVILRRDYSGAEVRATYESAFDDNAGRQQVDFNLGLNLAGGRTNILAYGSYADRNLLRAGDRNFIERYRERVQQVNPDYFPLVSPPLGTTTNVRSINGSDLTLVGGGSLGQPFTFVPVGYGGTGTDNGEGLVSNAGNYNLGVAQTAQLTGGNQSLFNPPMVKSLGGTVRHELSSRVSAFLEASGSESRARSPRNNASLFVIPAGAPGNPFDQTVLVATPAYGADLPFTSEQQNYRMAAGLIVTLPASWRSSLDYTWSGTRYKFLGDLGFDAAAAAAAVNIGAVDVFRDLNPSDADFAAFTADRSFVNPVKTALQDLSLRLSGPIPLALPGGRPTLSVLLEKRRETLDEFDAQFPSFAFEILTPKATQTVESAYGEILFPIVSESNAAPGARLLELQMAARWDRYETDAGTSVFLFPGFPPDPSLRSVNKLHSVDPTIGIRYRPIEDLMVRASYGTGFLPASINQISSVGVPSLQDLPVIDPLRNEVVGLIEYSTLGASGLKPEQSESLSAGMVFTPGFIPGLRASIDWTRITKDDAIDYLDPFTQDQLEALIELLPGRITRAAPAPGEATGRITAIDGGYANFSKAQVEAVDFALDYSFAATAAGNFSLASKATYLLHNISQFAPGRPEIENAGVRGDVHWRANLMLMWDLKNWTASWSTRFFDSYYINADRTATLDVLADKVPSQAYHDLFASYRLGGVGNSHYGNLLNGAEIQLGVKNVFNKKPPLDPTDRGLYYSALGDAMLASYYVSLRKAF